MKNDNILVSVVVPVYNSFKYMSMLLSSFENQTNGNFEVVFIDDCSRDDSFTKLKSELKKYKFKCKLLKNDVNKGPGVSRNIAIDNCSGKYITFVDSDDYVSENFIDEIISVINSYDVDSIIFDYNWVVEEKIVCRKSILGNYQCEITSNNAVALSNVMCWSKVFKKDLINNNNIKFPSLMRSEDVAFSKVCLFKSNNIYYINKPLYYHLNNATSIMNNRNTIDITCATKAFDYIEKNTEKCDAIEMVFIRECLYITVQMMIIKKTKTSEIRKFIDECNKKYIGWSKNPYIKYQPLYLRFLLKCIRFKLIFLLKLAFMFKK